MLAGGLFTDGFLIVGTFAHLLAVFPFQRDPDDSSKILLAIFANNFTLIFVFEFMAMSLLIKEFLQ